MKEELAVPRIKKSHPKKRSRILPSKMKLQVLEKEHLEIKMRKRRWKSKGTISKKEYF
jgi:hypothetical protein